MFRESDFLFRYLMSFFMSSAITISSLWRDALQVLYGFLRLRIFVSKRQILDYTLIDQSFSTFFLSILIFSRLFHTRGCLTLSSNVSMQLWHKPDGTFPIRCLPFWSKLVTHRGFPVDLSHSLYGINTCLLPLSSFFLPSSHYHSRSTLHIVAPNECVFLTVDPSPSSRFVFNICLLLSGDRCYPWLWRVSVGGLGQAANGTKHVHAGYRLAIFGYLRGFAMISADTDCTCLVLPLSAI